ncbi:energy-coupling factor transporter transmembrane component T family protein [Shimazuella kribbensis]|uniref:energy-coupling factor transporter transmembrane component T family protein n=1 Tax=Shimazuella kribbensis TaxID=139808 RepID=UPI000423EAB1|nr:energy-coupling factor transporter transmembrane component T [Shimazuella kribbensis]
MSRIVIGQFMPGNSILHRFDPRAKLLFVFLFFFLIFFVNNISTYLVIYLFVFFCIGLSQIRIRLFLGSIKPVLFIIIFTSILHLVMTKGGTILLTTPFFTVYEEGVRQAAFISSRFLILVVMASLLTFTTSSLDLTDALEQLMGPLRKIRVPVHELALMMSIALRFIPTLWEETEKIKNAQLARGANLESGNIFKRLTAYIPIFIPLFLSSFRRAEELAMAMEARAYRGGIGRTKFRLLEYKRKDYMLIVIFLLLVIGIGWLRS